MSPVLEERKVPIPDKLIVGTRLGYELSREDGHIYYVVLYQLVRGRLKPVDDRRIHKVKES